MPSIFDGNHHELRSVGLEHGVDIRPMTDDARYAGAVTQDDIHTMSLSEIVLAHAGLVYALSGDLRTPLLVDLRRGRFVPASILPSGQVAVTPPGLTEPTVRVDLQGDTTVEEFQTRVREAMDEVWDGGAQPHP